MFKQSNFAPIGGGTTDTPAFWAYKTDDLLADVMAAGYFIKKDGQLELNDLIWVIASDDEALLSYKGLGEPSYVVAPKAQESILFATSFDDQEPIGIDNPQNITYGPAQLYDTIELDANGVVTILKDGLFNLSGIYNVGRQGGSGGVAIIFARVLIDGVQVGNSTSTLVDNARIVIPEQFELTLPLLAGQKISIEIYRDSGGVDAGGLYSLDSALGWNPSPSASVRVAILL